jgi:hypothetical protein
MCFDDVDLPALRTRHDDSRRLIEEVDLDANHWATCPDARRFESRSSKPVEVKPTTHQCYVSYCAVQIPNTYLMCPGHWRKVSPATMREVWKWYRVKQSKGGDEATEKHWEAIEKARKEVEAKEAGPLLSEEL